MNLISFEMKNILLCYRAVRYFIIRRFFYSLVFLFIISLCFLYLENRPQIGYALSLCGNGSEAENYGFSYNLRQAHWTVGWESYVSESTINQVDEILDRLNNDQIAQTMILFLPQEQVGNRVNCAVHFLRYMKLGLAEGERKDNGFVFLLVVENGKIDVHYGVGLGLPALTAQNLTPLNRLAESTYASTKSMDEAILTLVKEYAAYARSKYTPLVAPSPTPVELTGTSATVLLCVICLILFIIIILAALSSRLGGRGGGGGFFSSSSPFFRPSSSSGSWSSPFSRGGGGSGRSGRGN